MENNKKIKILRGGEVTVIPYEEYNSYGETKKLELSYDNSMRIVKELLEVFTKFTNNVGAFFMYNYQGQEEKICKIITWDEKQPDTIAFATTPEIGRLFYSGEENVYILNCGGKLFRMALYDNANICGYVTESDPEKYIMCEIVELGTNSVVSRKEINFTFDITNMQFLQLFHVVRNGFKKEELQIIRREATNETIERMEKEFQGKVLMNLN